jgi:hypothetical protein
LPRLAVQPDLETMDGGIGIFIWSPLTPSNDGERSMNSIDKGKIVAAAVALVGVVVALTMTAIQVMANPSGTVVGSIELIVASGVIGMMGLAAFGLLWITQSTKRS